VYLVRTAVLALAATVANAATEPPSPSPAAVTLRVDAPADDDAPWKMIVSNEGDVPVRLAADARLLTMEIQPPAGAAADAQPGVKAGERKAKAPEPVVCKLPASLRPVGVVDDRAIILGPSTRYEEVINPILYCFDLRSARALTAGATVTAKLGFSPPPARGAKKAPLDPPFIVEPSTRDASVSAVKELTATPFTLSRDLAGTEDSIRSESQGPAGEDERAPHLELSAPARIDADSELTIGIPFTVKNTGQRPTTVHIRRDNLLFDVEGPDGTSHCGLPANRRVPQELFSVLRPGATQSLDVWVGELCPDIVFDRPGLYRIWPTLAFANTTDTRTVQNWTTPLRTREPLLVRILRGRLPFYAEPPRARAGSS
jgi:hypothetical protein